MIRLSVSFETTQHFTLYVPHTFDVHVVCVCVCDTEQRLRACLCTIWYMAIIPTQTNHWLIYVHRYWMCKTMTFHELCIYFMNTIAGGDTAIVSTFEVFTIYKWNVRRNMKCFNSISDFFCQNIFCESIRSQKFVFEF